MIEITIIVGQRDDYHRSLILPKDYKRYIISIIPNLIDKWVKRNYVLSDNILCASHHLLFVRGLKLVIT